jgi:hypothetical protein
MKKVYVALFGIALVGLGVWVSGCNLADIAGPSATTTTTRQGTTTTTHAATTTSTSTSTSTSTTLHPRWISGQISWDWGTVTPTDQYGVLWVLLSTSETEVKPDEFVVSSEIFTISIGQTQETYTFKKLTDGRIYTVGAILLVATTEVSPKPGDLGGKYSDGHLFSGVPATIECPAANKDFRLLDVVPTPNTYSFSGTVEAGEMGATPNDVRVMLSDNNNGGIQGLIDSQVDSVTIFAPPPGSPYEYNLSGTSDKDIFLWAADASFWDGTEGAITYIGGAGATTGEVYGGFMGQLTKFELSKSSVTSVETFQLYTKQ